MADDKGAKNINANLSSTTLFVRNLPFLFNNKELEKVFSEVGPVKRCFVVKDKDDPDKCRGFGYVTFALKEDAVQAQEKIRQIKGRKLFITFSNKKPRHIQRGPPDKKMNKEAAGSGDDDSKNVQSNSIEVTPSSTSKQPSNEKPKHKPKSKRSSAMNDDGRTVVLSGFSTTLNIKQLKKACKKNGEIERFVYPVENSEQPRAHAVYKSHKEARIAVNNLNGKTVKGEVLNAALRSKENKNISQKSLKRSRLIIRNLPFKCSKELLTEKFSSFGEISEVVMPTKTVGKGKKKLGFAFVQFKNVFDAAKALDGMNQKQIKGRPIAVDWTLPKKKYEILKVSEDKLEENEKGQSDDSISKKSAEEASDEVELESDQKDSSDLESNGEESEDLNNEDKMVPDDDDDDESEDNGSPTKKRRKLRDAREGKTIFIRNLPFDATEEEVCDVFKEFGEISYCKLVVDSVTEHSRGSAFVKFHEKQSADDCLEKYGDENIGSEELTMRKRPLRVTLAVTKGKVPQLLAEKDNAKKEPRDKRNLYLAKEGFIMPGSEAAVGLSKSDLQKRQKAEAEKKAKLKMPHYIVSKTRLCFRNLPLNVDEKKLSEVLRTVSDGKPKTVRKVRIMRNMDRLDSSGVGRSKGFGFAEFTTHQDALDVLRATNNNPGIFGPDRRPIVEFAIENSLILKRLEQRKAKNVKKVKESNNETDPGQKKRKREKEESRRKRSKKNEIATSVDSSSKAPETVSSNAKSNLKLETYNKKSNHNLEIHSSNANSNDQLECGLDDSKNKYGWKNKTKKKDKVLTNKIQKEGRNEMPNSRAKRKRQGMLDKEEEKFNEIVEKYKTKLFGENTKQLMTSRWFNS